uniref:EGF-like domain-containing protein n=1 Tax=Parastrongyloides trichosuri TaxID=131310 RepID=A0A0N4ZV61_PARTI
MDIFIIQFIFYLIFINKVSGNTIIIPETPSESSLPTSLYCNLIDEGIAGKCAGALVDYVDFKKETLHPLLSNINNICEELSTFKKCTKHVNHHCLDSIIPKQIRLFEYLCQFPVKDSIIREKECFLKVQKEEYMTNCFNNISNIHSSTSNNLFHYDTSYTNSTSIIDEERDLCKIIKNTSDCYLQSQFLKDCPKAANVEHDILLFIAEKLNIKGNCDLPLFHNVIRKFEEEEMEKTIGTCNENGNCTCVEGYRGNNETKKCVDIDECAEESHLCSQICINTKGSYKCDCYEKIFKLSENGKSCDMIDQETPAWLYFAHGQSIWNISDDGKHFQLQRAGLQKTAMIDVDIKDNKIFYVDIGTNVIEKINIDGAFPEPIQTYEVDGVEGIAVDWVARNLYTARRSDIFVQTLDGRFRKSLYKNVFKMPRALACHSLKGKLFGTDWSSNAFIASANMDGSDFKKIVTDGIVWPNALTIDIYANKIYWADAFLDTIQMANLDGSMRKTIISDPASVPHVFGMTISNDYIYWTDWTYRGILRANKNNGNNVTVLAQTALLPYSIKLFHKYIQPEVPNPCEEMKCSQLCLLKENAKSAVCSCSDGFTLNEDGKTCTSNCNDQTEIICGGSDPRCISKRYLCDGKMHCQDSRDEQNCDPRICLPGQFQCHDNKKCLPAKDLCDGVSQCLDNSDEMYCSSK